jgi:putative spermidine/putrescine transport system substrate-binding protein
MDAFARDCLELAVERLKRGELDRRSFLAGLAALGLTPAALEGEAQAAASEIVAVNWGGDALKYMQAAWGDPYVKDTGVNVVWDGTGPSAGKIKAMVESKHVTWDVCDSGSGSTLVMGKNGYLDEFDYAIVDKTKLLKPQFAYKWGMANYLFSYVIAWDTAKFGGKKPKSWADFWNVKEFPGKRTMRKDIQGSLEAALMADGVPFEKIYPIDVDRAFKKLKEIKEHTIFWAAGAESQQLLRDGEVTMGSLWNTRVNALVKDTNERITWTWEQGILCDGCWVVPKGNPAGKDVYKFIASTQIPERQAMLFDLFGNGPANPAAIPLLPADKKRFDPGSNAEVQLAIGALWYGEYQDKVNNDFLDLVSS